MLDNKQRGLLSDILDSAKVLRGYVAGLSHEDFMANTEKQDAVLRRLELIGEAAGRLAPETQALFPGLPFRQMRGMRNIIAHDYGEVDLDQVWNTASGKDIQETVAALSSFFDRARNAGDAWL